MGKRHNYGKDKEKMAACLKFFTELSDRLSGSYEVIYPFGKMGFYSDKYLVPVGKESEITYYSKPARSFRISNHWNWRQNFDIDKCSLPNYIQCFCADMPVSKANSQQKGKKTEPIFAISVAYFGEDQKYHVLFGEKYNRQEHKWEWVESSIDEAVRSVLYGKEFEFHD